MTRGLITGSAVTGTDGSATVSIPPRPYKPVVLLAPDSDQVAVAILSWTTDAAGNYTGFTVKAYYITPSVAKTTATVVSGISKTTATVLRDVSASTGTFVTGISVDRRNFTTASAVTGVSVSTGTFVTSIPGVTGDAAGRYTVDSYGVVHHDHAIPSPTTGTAVTGVSTTTGSFVTGITTTAGTTVVANVTASTGTAVTGVSKTTATVLGDVTASTTNVLSDVSLSASPAPNVRVFYLVVL